MTKEQMIAAYEGAREAARQDRDFLLADLLRRAIMRLGGTPKPGPSAP